MNLLLDIILWLCVAAVIAIGAFASRMQSITLWAGKRITPEGMNKELPRGFQDAITPKIQDKFNTILPISYVAILVIGSMKRWYLGVALLILAFVGMFIVRAFLPNKIKFYLKIINYYMINKTADYAKISDVMRAEASKDVADQLQQLYFETDDNELVPDFSDIKKMPLGR